MILLTAATILEVEPLVEHLEPENFRLIITGVGSAAVIYHILKVVQTEKPDLIIQPGIAGSFDEKIKPGEVVIVRRDRFADLGVKEENWKDIFDMNLADPDEFPFSDGWLNNPHDVLMKSAQLPLVNAITINEITTDPERVNELINKYEPSIESMEGAAFHYVCLKEKIPFIQIRAISNHITERNKKNWKIKESIENLNQCVLKLLHQ